MNVDLYNIEDLLSIAYMEFLINKNSKSLKQITDFIKVVVESYSEDVDLQYAEFFARLIANVQSRRGNARYHLGHDTFDEFIPTGKFFESTSFGLINLNYDLLIEKSLQSVLRNISSYHIHSKLESPYIEYFTPKKKIEFPGIPFAKLHGSVEKEIIPPTWNKSINKEIHEDWELATNLLTNATHIIFLGYSLPHTDNYIRFLFSSSLNSNKRLKRISAITLDSGGQTMQRYKAMFALDFHFHNSNLDQFFQFVSGLSSEIDFDYFDEEFTDYIAQQ
ncbi:SIR2 family protein [Leptospira sarikeiensis]|uniref:Uncharacterized protein n=1 Tax=Leptospira sarikeiensis TaxID=2484943 RepID=A0A4R9K911_9LEPT|nr:SIR2 family protein [Leptospira sarikeiensis]TGL61177.1 hypothetical protein EHQ64_11210 [Leptospira sarikeiensis]